MQSLINDATRIKNISSNYIRAHQAEREGDDRTELRLLLFTVQDISVLLKAWHTDRRDAAMAISYAKSLHNTTARIQTLIEKQTTKEV
jgi:hypothetical protein